MKKEDVDITLTDGHVDIVAEKKGSKEEKGECYLCQERGGRSTVSDQGKRGARERG